MGVRAKHVFRWDLDKTYLRTEFDTMKDLWRAAFEDPADKRAYPGATALLRSLRTTIEHRICIISGSPSQMRGVLSAKLALDGVEFDEFVLKSNLRNLMRGRFRALRSQIPYKLPALLESRLGLLGSPSETLFGDDSETDAIVYALYDDILRGQIDNDELYRILNAARAYKDEIERTIALAESVDQSPSVQRILIHLDRLTATERFAHFGPRLVPIYNYFQAALVLYDDGILDAGQVAFVGKDMFLSGEHTVASLANSVQDLIIRGRMTRDTAQQLALDLRARGVGETLGQDGLPTLDTIAWHFSGRIRDLGSAQFASPVSPATTLDYFQIVDHEFRSRRATKHL